MNLSLILLGFIKSVVTNPALLVQLEWAKGMAKGMAKGTCVEKGDFRGMSAENGIVCLELEAPSILEIDHCLYAEPVPSCCWFYINPVSTYFHGLLVNIYATANRLIVLHM